MSSMRMERFAALVAVFAIWMGAAACDDTELPGPGNLDQSRPDGFDVSTDGPPVGDLDAGVDGELDVTPDSPVDADPSDSTASDATTDLTTDPSPDVADVGGDVDTGPVIPPCGTTEFSYDAGVEAVTSAVVAGTFNGWAPDVASGAWPLSDDDGDNIWTATHVLDPGEYHYKFVINGDWRQDPTNPDTAPDGYGGFNSVLTIDCGSAALTVISYSSDDATGAIEATVQFSPTGGSLDPTGVVVTLDNEPVSASDVSTSGNDIIISMTGVADGIHDLRVAATSLEGAWAGPILLKYYLGVSTDWEDALLYFVMTDRFRNGDMGNDSPVADADARVNWQGGDFAGLRQTIESNYFDELGVSALWISWPIANFGGSHEGGRPSEHACGLNPATMSTVSVNYTAYHGYWPANLDSIDPHFGALDELKAMVDIAHEHGIRVLLDFTANHVHTSSSFYQSHKYEYFSWADQQDAHICQNVGWDGPEAETCWFTPYLADLDYRNPATVTAMVDHAIDWINATGADGFRLDAVKHINKAFLTGLRNRLEAEIELTEIPFYLVGETFTGDTGKIAEFIGDDLIHGQFDFPLNQQVLEGFATRDTGLDAMDSAVRGIKAAYGNGLMSNFIGNHDIARFLSMAAGDIYCPVWDVTSNIAQGWLYPPDRPESEEPYRMLRLAFTYIMTVPGIPLIYYGDEFGMPGAGDPDNRRMMRFEGDLNTNESNTLEFMRRLGTVRAEHPALRTGSWGTDLWHEADVLAYPRVHADETVIVVLNRGAEQRTLSLSTGPLGLSNGDEFEDALSDSPTVVTVSGGHLSVTVPAQSPVILVPH